MLLYTALRMHRPFIFSLRYLKNKIRIIFRLFNKKSAAEKYQGAIFIACRYYLLPQAVSQNAYLT